MELPEAGSRSGPSFYLQGSRESTIGALSPTTCAVRMCVNGQVVWSSITEKLIFVSAAHGPTKVAVFVAGLYVWLVVPAGGLPPMSGVGSL